MQTKKTDAQIFVERIQKDPKFMVVDVMGCNIYDKQAEVLDSIWNNQRTSVAGCNGPGKTFIIARAVISFLLAFRDSIVITTAPTWRQVENVVWREIRDAVAKSKTNLGIKPLQTKISLAEKWYALGISSDNPDNFRGFHAEHVLVLVDEAGGMPFNLLDAIEGTLTSANVRLCYIGNPTVNEGPFYDSFASPFFHKIKISAFDTPNFKANGIKNVEDLKKLKNEDFAGMKIPFPHLVTPLWAWTRLHSWGEDTSIFQSLVCANFPKESKDSLLSLSWLEAAINKEWDEEKWKNRNIIKSIGIDVARTGEDSSVLTAMENFKHLESDRHQGKRTTETVGLAIQMADRIGFHKKRDVFVIDDIGVGGGVTDQLIEDGWNVIPFNGAAKDFVEDEERFFNNRAQLFWDVRLGFRDGICSVLDEGKYIKHLLSIKTKTHSSGKIIVIPKEEIKKAIGESPDDADSYAMAYLGCKTQITEFNYKDTNDLDREKNYDDVVKTITGDIISEEF